MKGSERSQKDDVREFDYGFQNTGQPVTVANYSDILGLLPRDCLITKNFTKKTRPSTATNRLQHSSNVPNWRGLRGVRHASSVSQFHHILVSDSDHITFLHIDSLLERNPTYTEAWETNVNKAFKG